MATTQTESRGTRIVLGLFGVLVATVGILADWLTGQPTGMGSVQVGVIAFGLLCCVGSILIKRIPGAVANLALIGVTVLGSLLAAEAGVRAVGLDLTGEQVAFNTMPIWFQQPTEPVGEVFFRRPGPAKWTGRVLTDHLARHAGIVDAYPNEESYTFSYDSLGFRNPEAMNDWEMVVVGDSFVELGHLPDDQLYTSRLAEALGIRVKNLGVSSTGTLTHTFYLKEYGKASSTRDAVLVFYEGNDVRDLESEREALERFPTEGREYRVVPHGASIVRMILNGLEALRPQPEVPEGTLSTTQQRVSIGELPPAPEQLDSDRMDRVRDAITEWVATADALGLRSWVVLMPANRRVYDHLLEFDDDAPSFLRDWQASELPQVVERAARSNGSRFVDLTPALIEEVNQSRLPYNPVWDTHLNRLGAQVVGEILLNEMSDLNADDAESTSADATLP